MNSKRIKIIFLITCCFLLISGFIFANRNKTQIVIADNAYNLQVNTSNFLIWFSDDKGDIVVPMAETSGLYLNDSPVLKTKVLKNSEHSILFRVVNAEDETARVSISFLDGISKITVEPENDQINKVSLRFGGMPVAHGLGDAGAFEKSFNLIEPGKKTFNMANNGSTIRWLSTFIIFPKNNFAGVFFDRGKKSVTLGEETYQLNTEIKGKSTFYFFLGDNKDIYANYKKIRNEVGFEDIKPKSRLFELGWESWDALGWNTNQFTVREVLQKFHNEGYPIRWAVTGSGFWEKGGITTNFGKWGNSFPDAKAFKSWMNDNDIKWMIGLRTNFVPDGGPYIPLSDERDHNLTVNSYNGNPLSNEGLKNNYFLKDENGVPLRFTSKYFPQVPCYMLDGNQPGAALWFQQHYTLWDVDGIKEDTMMPVEYETSIFNKPKAKIASEGGLVMARNGEFVAPGTLMRINDTRVYQMEDRIPNNYLQYAASGAPNVYSDVVGTFNMRNLREIEANIRHAWLLSLTAGMAVGVYPEKWPVDKQELYKKAVNFHYSLVPYLYSAAMKSYETGFPYTLTPLSIAFANDNDAYNFDDFQWLIGESVLATPLLKNYKVGKRDVYLPAGVWYDWETGNRFSGPITIKDYKIPLQNTPCFVGGNGIVVLRKINSDDLICRVYDVGKEVVSDFYTLSEGNKYSINVLNTAFDTLKVVEAETGNPVAFYKGNNYIEFPIVEGSNYDIR